MKHFRLPDLGEGLAEAEIVEWAVKDGQKVAVNDVLLSVETAKAVVDVPSPVAGVIKACVGNAGDVIAIGSVLVEFEEGEDQGSVVGQMQSQQQAISDDFIIGAVAGSGQETIRMTPQARALLKRLNLTSDALPQEPDKMWAEQDVIAAYVALGEGREQLKGSRKNMAQWMSNDASRAIVPASLSDDIEYAGTVDLSEFTPRLLHAMALACQEEPALNAWFEGESCTRQQHKTVNIGLAVDSEHGLYVPVIRDVGQKTLTDLHAEITEIATKVRKRQIEPERLEGATITLSNFGAIGGRYATPVVTPPQVAILGIGKLFTRAGLNTEGKLVPMQVIPASLTFDHRACTGGEATRFLTTFAKQLLQTFA